MPWRDRMAIDISDDHRSLLVIAHLTLCTVSVWCGMRYDSTKIETDTRLNIQSKKTSERRQ